MFITPTKPVASVPGADADDNARDHDDHDQADSTAGGTVENAFLVIESNEEEEEALVVLFATTRALFWDSFSIHHPRQTSNSIISSSKNAQYHHHYHPDGSWARGELGKCVVAFEFVQIQGDDDLYPFHPATRTSKPANARIVSSPTPIRDRARRKRVLEQVHSTLWSNHYPSLPSSYSTRNVGLYYQRPSFSGGYDWGAAGGSSSTMSHLNLYSSPVMGTYCLLILVQHEMDQRQELQKHQIQNYQHVQSPQWDDANPPQRGSSKHSREVKRLLQELQERFYHHHEQQQQTMSHETSTSTVSITSLSLQVGISGAIQGILYLRQGLKAPRLFASHIARYSVNIIQALLPLLSSPETDWSPSIPLGMSKGLVGILFTLLACSKHDWKQIDLSLNGSDSISTGGSSLVFVVRDLIDRLWNEVKQSLNIIIQSGSDSQQDQAHMPHKLLQHLQWSNGTTGLVCLLIRASQVFESKRYFQNAQFLGDYIWNQYHDLREKRNSGLHSSLSSSFGLANGIAGIAMCFILMARHEPPGSQWERKADVMLHHSIHDWNASTDSLSSPALAPPCYGIWDGLGGLLSVLFFRFHTSQPNEFPMFPRFSHGSRAKIAVAAKSTVPALVEMEESEVPLFRTVPSTLPPHVDVRPLQDYAFALKNAESLVVDRFHQPMRQRSQLLIDTSKESPYPVVSRRSQSKQAGNMAGKQLGHHRPTTTAGKPSTSTAPVRLTRATQLRMERMKSPWTRIPETSNPPRIHPSSQPVASFHLLGMSPSTHVSVEQGHNDPAFLNVPLQLFRTCSLHKKTDTNDSKPSERKMKKQAEHKAKLLKTKESRRRREEQTKLRSTLLEAERKQKLETRKPRLREEAAARSRFLQDPGKTVLEEEKKLARPQAKTKEPAKGNAVHEKERNVQHDKERLQRTKGIRQQRETVMGSSNPVLPRRLESGSAKNRVILEKKIEKSLPSKTLRQESYRKQGSRATTVVNKSATLKRHIPQNQMSPKSSLQTPSTLETEVDSNLLMNELSVDSCDSQHRVTEENELHLHPGTLSEAHVDSKESIVEATADTHASQVSVLEESQLVPEQGERTTLKALNESNVLGSVLQRDAGEEATAITSLTDQATMRPPHDHSIGYNEFSMKETPRKVFGINLAEDEDFASINAMFSKAESMLESQLASILGCPDDAENVTDPRPNVRAAADTIISSDSGDSDVPALSEMTEKRQVFEGDQPHDTSRNVNEATPSNEIGDCVTASEMTVPSQEFSDSTVINQEAERSTAPGVVNMQNDEGLGRTLAPAFVLDTPDLPSRSRAATLSASMKRQKQELRVSRKTPSSDDDSPTWEAIDQDSPEDTSLHGPMPTITTATPHEPTVLHGLPTFELSTPLELALPLDDRSVAEPLTPTDERTLFDDPDAIGYWTSMDQATTVGSSTLEAAGSPTNRSSTSKTAIDDVARGNASTLDAPPATLQESLLDSSVGADKKRPEQSAEEEDSDFNDDFARMDSLFEEAENQLAAELASILGPSPELHATGRRGVQEEERDEDLISPIVEEDSMLASDFFAVKTERSTIGCSTNSRVRSAENDITPTSAARFSKGTLRRRGARRVAPGN